MWYAKLSPHPMLLLLLLLVRVAMDPSSLSLASMKA
jgi:hypothetical protein